MIIYIPEQCLPKRIQSPEECDPGIRHEASPGQAQRGFIEVI
jgi:hypothetical protein